MKIYLVERPGSCGYDNYDKFVCFANSEEEARRLHPIGDDCYQLYEDGWRMVHSDGTVQEKASKYNSWTKDVASLKVSELSSSPRDNKPEVILASYNAG